MREICGNCGGRCVEWESGEWVCPDCTRIGLPDPPPSPTGAALLKELRCRKPADRVAAIVNALTSAGLKVETVQQQKAA